MKSARLNMFVKFDGFIIADSLFNFVGDKIFDSPISEVYIF